MGWFLHLSTPTSHLATPLLHAGLNGSPTAAVDQRPGHHFSTHHHHIYNHSALANISPLVLRLTNIHLNLHLTTIPNQLADFSLPLHLTSIVRFFTNSYALASGCFNPSPTTVLTLIPPTMAYLKSTRSTAIKIQSRAAQVTVADYSRPPLLRLPVELLHLVCIYLEPTEVAIFRLLNREIAEIGISASSQSSSFFSMRAASGSLRTSPSTLLSAST